MVEGVTLNIHSNIPVKIRDDLVPAEIVILWLQVHLSHLKPMLIDCCYRPPSMNNVYLDKICDILDRECDFDYEIYFMGSLKVKTQRFSFRSLLWHLGHKQ